MKPYTRILIPLVSLTASCAPSLPPGTVQPSALIAGPAQKVGPPEPGRPVEAQYVPKAVTENETFTTVDGTPQYKIGPGDVLEISFPKAGPQEKVSAAVKRTGTIAVAGVEIKVAGLTTEQAEGRLREALAPFYVRPQVEVLVKEYNSKKATALGAVSSRAGVFPLTGRTTLTELLLKAGGPAANADLENVRVTEREGEVYTVNLIQLILQGRLRQEPVLDAGSVIFVPEKLPEQKRVFILGEVQRPGSQPYIPNLTMVQALGQAGGGTDLAVSSSARVIRGDLEKPVLIAADFNKVLKDGDLRFDVPLQPGDILYVPRSLIGDWNVFLAKLTPTFSFLTLGGGGASTFKSLIAP